MPQITISSEIVDLAEQNEELYIQGLPSFEALRNFVVLSQGETLRSKSSRNINAASESINLCDPNSEPPASNLSDVTSIQAKEHGAISKPLACPC